MIDTFSIFYKNKSNVNPHRIPYVVRIYGDAYTGGFNIQVKPSRIYLNNKTSTISELISVKEDLDKIFNEVGQIKRIDFAYDMISSLNDNFKLCSLFISCMAVIRDINLEKLFKTSTHTIRNMKIKKTSKALTIYNSLDKPTRKANSRIENRIFKIRISDKIEQQIKTLIKEYITELDLLISKVTQVENFRVGVLTNYWNDSNFAISNLHEFVSIHSDYILTRNILVKFLKAIGYPYKIENFIDKHTRNNKRIPFNFVSKTALKDLVDEVKKEVKKTSKF